LLLLLLLLLQVWAELLVLLAEGELEAQPWDQERYRRVYPVDAAAAAAAGVG
jgi:hypothetical protein